MEAGQIIELLWVGVSMVLVVLILVTRRGTCRTTADSQS